VRVFNSILFALISDSSEHSHKTKFLYLLAAGPHINKLIAPGIAAALISQSIFTPFWMAISINCIASSLINFITQSKRL